VATYSIENASPGGQTPPTANSHWLASNAQRATKHTDKAIDIYLEVTGLNLESVSGEDDKVMY